MLTTERVEITVPGGRILILQFVPADARPLFALIDRNRGHLSQFDDETADKYPDFESVLDSILNPKDPNRLRLGIWCEGDLAGSINFTFGHRNAAEIGYWVGSEFCRQGLATVATRSIIEYAKRLVNVDRVTANAHINNLASRIVLTRAGMEETHRSDTHVFFALGTAG